MIGALGFLFLLRDLRRSRKDPALLLLALVFLSSAISYVISFPPVWARIDSAFGVPGIAVPLSQSCVMLVIVFQTSVVAHWALPQAKARQRAKLIAVAGASAIVGLFATFSQIPPDDFAHFQVRTLAYQAYLGIYICAYTIAQVYVAAMCWQQSRRATNPWVTTSLLIIMLGAAITVGQSVIRTGNLLGVTGDTWMSWAWLCGDVGAFLSLTGYFLPTLVDRGRGVYGWAADHYTYRRLGPLWEALYSAAPSIAALPPQPHLRALVRLKPISFPLYRRVTEIRDGMIELRPYLTPDVREAAEARCLQQGMKDPDLAAAVAAEQISQALASHKQKRVAETRAEYADSRLAVQTTDEDQHLLLRIASHFKTPPAQATA
ncbi:MAB_1171c family putative transporter [Streptomyces sp. NPDC037389]|uniref:MAB_1171c family putative transporter n=1 Tax=Streptomyces sp. NPDC037389 TaxID=3155369 RepID=UPI0033F1681C